ncbi:MAG: hypothetical protein KOO62_04795 [candidate division Zixibacteria bacterium]|nr:hypothetical protein [candidate division Zixibacteria bacterium]
MKAYSRFKGQTVTKFLLAIIVCLIILHPLARADVDDLVRQALCDVRILYLAGDEETIDWASLYYLNDHYGCAIDIVLPGRRAIPRISITTVPGRGIVMRRVFLPDDKPEMIDSIVHEIFPQRRPDIILIGPSTDNSLFATIRQHLLALEPSSSYQFNIRRMFEQTDYPNSAMDSSRQVVLNATELLRRYRERMRSELPLLGINTAIDKNPSQSLIRYQLLTTAGSEEGADFLSGLPRNRLVDIFERLLPQGPRRVTLVRQARQLNSSLQSSLRVDGRARAEAILDGYRTMLDLYNAVGRDSLLLQSKHDLKPYFDGLVVAVQEAALEAVGIRWDGKVILRDSPRGPKLKFRASLSANGPKEVLLKSVWFVPYWDNARVAVDTVSVKVTPHQTFAREYLIDIDRRHLEAEQPDSLVFITEMEYGPIPMTVRSTLPIWERPELGITFEPDFYFVPSPAELDIDRVVSSATVRAVITKPSDFVGKVNFEFITPRGLFAGAYNKTLDLRPGATQEIVRLGFSISKLFELGTQPLVIELSQDGRLVAADSAIVRIASCRISDKIKIGFLADTSGAFEDILQMTGATFRPLTDRGLITADLNAYNVLVVGSGAHRSFPSLAKMKDRFETYMRQGGSLVVFGQPEDWPGGVFPVSLAPVLELVDRNDITNRIEKAKILSQPYKISEKSLFSSFFKKGEVIAAAVAPAERVLVTPSGATLLSVSRIGEGQLIYCGLPLLDLVGRLNIDAIHLLANIVNY